MGTALEGRVENWVEWVGIGVVKLEGAERVRRLFRIFELAI